MRKQGISEAKANRSENTEQLQFRSANQIKQSSKRSNQDAYQIFGSNPQTPQTLQMAKQRSFQRNQAQAALPSAKSVVSGIGLQQRKSLADPTSGKMYGTYQSRGNQDCDEIHRIASRQITDKSLINTNQSQSHQQLHNSKNSKQQIIEINQARNKRSPPTEQVQNIQQHAQNYNNLANEAPQTPNRFMQKNQRYQQDYRELAIQSNQMELAEKGQTVGEVEDHLGQHGRTLQKPHSALDLFNKSSFTIREIQQANYDERFNKDIKRFPSPLGAFSKYAAAAAAPSAITAKKAPELPNSNQGPNCVVVTTTNGNTKSLILEGGGSNQSSTQNLESSKQKNNCNYQNNYNSYQQNDNFQNRVSTEQSQTQQKSIQSNTKPIRSYNIQKNELTININKPNMKSNGNEYNSQSSSSLRVPAPVPSQKLSGMFSSIKKVQQPSTQPLTSIKAKTLGLEQNQNTQNTKAKNLNQNIFQYKNGLNSVGTMKSSSTMNLGTGSQGSSSKRYYHYCIDTNQIIQILEYSIQMLNPPIKSIMDKASALTKTDDLHEMYQYRSKSSSDSSTGDKSRSQVMPAEKKSASQNKYAKRDAAKSDDKVNEANSQSKRVDIFCAGNYELQKHVQYMNLILKEQADKLNLQEYQTKEGKQKSQLFKPTESKKALGHIIDFARVFGLDDLTYGNIQSYQQRISSGINISLSDAISNQQNGVNIDQSIQNDLVKFTYFVENEKMLSSKTLFVDAQRQTFVKVLKELKSLLSEFIRKKYQNCTTKIGFSSERELFNIFNRMLNSSKGFFNKLEVRKILGQFWMSCKEVISAIRVRTQADSQNEQPLAQANAAAGVSGINDLVKINKVDEVILKNNFYMRLEIVARGRYIYETFECRLPNYVGVQSSSGYLNGGGSQSDHLRLPSACNKQYPIHQAIFESNFRTLSKILKQEQDGIFYAEKNQLDPCGNTPLMLAVKLGNIDAVKILSDMYTCPKLRPLNELMNAKEIAIAMKNRQILKILISSNQKIKQQFFEKNKEAIFQVLERMPDFKVDLSLTCDSNWFPVFSSVAPNDTYKIYKQGSNLRLDMSLLGLQKFNLIKGNISVIFKGRNTGDNEGEFLVVDNKLQTVNNVFNRNNENKIIEQINEILTGKQVLKKYQTHSAHIKVETDRLQRAITKKINDYDSQKYILKSRYTMIKYQMNLAQIDQIKDFKSFDEYSDTLQADYFYLIQMHLDSMSYEREEPAQEKGLGNFFKLKFGAKGQNDAPLTSRINFGGTSKMDNQGGFSSRENSNFRNLAEVNNHNQMHTQEDQPAQNSNEKSYSNIFGVKKNSTLAGGQKVNQGQTGLHVNKQITIKKKQQKQVVANLWLSKSYPFNIDQFLPLINVLSFCSKQIRQFNKFLVKYPIPQSNEYFPIQARIPLFMTMEAVFSFKNIQMDFNDSSVFEIDKEVAIKQSQNLALFAKQQISFLNMHSSLDTQEDKQAKALKEIYKLCKTDEGDHSGDCIDGHNDNMPRVDEVNERNNGYESENSDRVKELFNKMLTNQDEDYDIKHDELLMRENDDHEDLLGQEAAGGAQNQTGQVPAQINSNANQHQEQVESMMAQSRNFSNGSTSFQDIRNSFTHNEMLRKRKNGKTNDGRTPSKQFSLQSDITESVEVSERSFNDKLAKLQIHSFQNVKFMSQFKKNMMAHDQNSPFGAKRLEDALAEQFGQSERANEGGQASKFRMSNLQQFQEQSKITQRQNQGQMIANKANLIINNITNNQNKYAAGANGAVQNPNSEKQLANHQNKGTIGRPPSGSASAREVEPGAAQPKLKNENMSNFSYHSYMSSSMNYGENIYDSKLNEERPKINKSLGKHQINNNLHMWTKMGAKIYKDPQPRVLQHRQMEGESSGVIVAGERQLGSGQLVGNKPPLKLQNLVSSGTASRSKNFNNQLSNLGFTNQSNATMGTVSGSTVKMEFQPRAIPRQKNQINNLIQPGNSAVSLGISQIENAAEVGSLAGSSAAGMLQSMSTLMGPAAFGGGIGGISHMHGGLGSVEAGSGSTVTGHSAGGMAASQTSGGQGTMFGGYSRQGDHGPNSTADSSVHKLAMTPGSILSMAPRESRDSGYIKGSMASKNQPSILDKDKLKLILDNLRNDKPNGVKNQIRPRYLNTIESEGNLPSQQFNNRGDQLHSMVSKASNNQLSHRSIHSLESLQSEGSQGERDQTHDGGRRAGIAKANNRSERPSGGSAGNDYEHPKIENEIQHSQHFQERSQNVPMHTGDNGSQASHENHEEDYGDVGLQHQLQQQVFSYEKQHRTRGLDNVDVKMMEQQQKGPVGDLTYREPRTGKRQDSTSQQPPQSKALQLRINPQTHNKQQDTEQLNSLKLNFFQKVTTFIQESITDRKHYPQNQMENEYHQDGNQQQNEYYDRVTNEDKLFYRHLSNIKSSKSPAAPTRSLTNKKSRQSNADPPSSSGRQGTGVRSKFPAGAGLKDIQIQNNNKNI